MGFTTNVFTSSPPPSPLYPDCQFLSAFLSQKVAPIHINPFAYPSKKPTHRTLSRKASVPFPTMQPDNNETNERIPPLARERSSRKQLKRSRTLPNADASSSKTLTRSTSESQNGTLSKTCSRSRTKMAYAWDKPLPEPPANVAPEETGQSKAAQWLRKQRTMVLNPVPTRSQGIEQPSVGAEASSSSSSLASTSTSVEKALDTPATEFDVDLAECKNAYQAKDHFRTVDGSRYHPYSLDDAPYVQSYNRAQLDNDRATEKLLNRLAPLGSPTFHDYGAKPPSNVLDLGCGHGGWVVKAANAWKSSGTKVTGFDLVDVTGDVMRDLEHCVVQNITWTRGNFLKYSLPFDDDSFDLVRMANLSLAVPFTSWRPLLEEVRRVLMPGGRLEFIDDMIFFPYEKPQWSPPTRAIVPKRSANNSCDSDSGSDEEDDDDATIRVKDLPPLPLHIDTAWEDRAEESRDLERMFQHMLEKDLGMHIRPSDFLERMLRSIFGKANAKKAKAFHLALAPGSTDASAAPETPVEAKKTWMPSIEWPKRDKGVSMDDAYVVPSKIPDVISAKAAARLGISASPPNFPEITSHKAAGRLGISSTSLRRPVQSPGLILYPSHFIPIPPMELEMHACRYMHTLLGCAASLGEFISDFKNEDGVPHVGQEAFKELLWDYECFRRPRFNWPRLDWQPRNHVHGQSSSSDKDKDAFTTRTGHFRANSDSSIFGRSRKDPSAEAPTPLAAPTDTPRDFRHLTHIRTIRVFHAVKA